MKKSMSLLLAAVLLALSLAGCSGGNPNPGAAPTNTPTGTPSTAPAAPGPSEETQPPDGSGDKDNSEANAIWDAIVETVGSDKLPMLDRLDDEMIEQYYYIDASMLDEHVVMFPVMNVNATEIFIAKVSDENIDAVLEGIDKRVEDAEQVWASYLPAQYELVKNHQIVQRNGWVMLVISEHSEEIIDTFNQMT